MSAMQADHVAFVNSEEDSKILSKYYADSVVARVPLESYGRLRGKLPPSMACWVDSGVDGLNDWEATNPNYQKFMKSFTQYDAIADPSFQAAPKKEAVQTFVDSVLTAVSDSSPKWLSVPQLPLVDNNTRNKINKQLAECTKDWCAKHRFSGKLILPIIVTNQRQLNLKVARRAKIEQARGCYERAGANGFWVAESTLNDQEGAKTFDRRFQALISFHQEINIALPTDATSVAGPYWGLNLILWARALVRHPAVALGNFRQYRLAGGHKKPPNVRIAIPPLLRCAVMNTELKKWFADSVQRVPSSDAARGQLEFLHRNFDRLEGQGSREQIGKFYKDWFERILAMPGPGRALALYQEFSSAYVLGSSLPDLPPVEGTGRKPERVAQQLMLCCL